MEAFRPFPGTFPARFLARPNRFLLRCDYKGRTIDAHLPNPGRLMELLLPGSVVRVMAETSPSRKTAFTAVAIEHGSFLIMLHTHRTNDAARWLIENHLVPGLADAGVVRSEVTLGRRRFDFLLRDGKGELVVEVKSCTLSGMNVAMFPDAITERGAHHLRELARLAGEGTRSIILFVVHHPSPTIFMPDFHTDPAFARTLMEVRRKVTVVPIGVRWEPDLSLSTDVRELAVPWEYIEGEARDRGAYICLLRLPRPRNVPIGSLGDLPFREGFYAYVGSAMANLTARTERHRHLRKQHRWHIDWLRQAAEFVTVLPIRSSARLECEVARSLSSLADWSIAGFGSSDCSCPAHLFGFAANPLLSGPFHDLLRWFRMDRHAALAGARRER